LRCEYNVLTLQRGSENGHCERTSAKVWKAKLPVAYKRSYVINVRFCEHAKSSTTQQLNQVSNCMFGKDSSDKDVED